MRLRSVFALVSLLISAGVMAQPITPDQKKEVLAAMKVTIEERAFVPKVDFKQWSGFIEARAEQIEKAETIPAFSNEVNRALREFGFSHIRLSTPRQATARTQTSQPGIGVMVTQTPEGLRINSVRDESPAKTAGLAQGELIVAVDGKKPEDRDSLTGELGTTKVLRVQDANGVIREVSVTIQRISTVRVETLTWPREDTAMLRVFTFSTGYGAANIEKLLTEASRAQNLILDLRNNGGGSTANLNHLLSLLLPDRTDYGVFVTRNQERRFREANPEKEPTLEAIAAWSTTKTRTRERTLKPFQGKIAVLINRGSGSASEIAAAALRESASAPLIGSPSAGAVLASVFGRLPHGFQLQYPISDFVTAKGMRLEGNPLKPDHEVTGSGTTDPVVAKALELFPVPAPAAKIGA